ncbi:hypothetical protein [Jiella sp. R10]|uniref:Uncharacterized protein n=1 Tax=Antarcticirhabdus aurantiaca TaxID=2606717 RepID=A0ACD4NRK6_9HYPH|nr:hypothetical protein OXU80_04805 [Jeongeuplla avenae]
MLVSIHHKPRHPKTTNFAPPGIGRAGLSHCGSSMRATIEGTARPWLLGPSMRLGWMGSEVGKLSSNDFFSLSSSLGGRSWWPGVP